MKIYDVTRTYEAGMTKYYKLDDPVLDRYGKMEEGARCNTSRIAIACHLGTHIDSPFHFDPNGVRIDKLDVSRLLGKAKLLRFKEKTVSKEALVKEDFEGVKILVFSFGLKSEERAQPYFTPEAARYLVEQGIEVIATDNLNVDVGKERPIHEIFLLKGLYIVEGLDLENVPEGCYNCIALPLKLKDLEASAARVLLIGEE